MFRQIGIYIFYDPRIVLFPKVGRSNRVECNKEEAHNRKYKKIKFLSLFQRITIPSNGESIISSLLIALDLEFVDTIKDGDGFGVEIRREWELKFKRT
jgi:hypothetical protein